MNAAQVEVGGTVRPPFYAFAAAHSTARELPAEKR